MIILLALLLVLVFAGLGFTLHALWVVAAFLLVLWLIGLVIGRGEGAGSRCSDAKGRTRRINRATSSVRVGNGICRLSSAATASAAASAVGAVETAAPMRAANSASSMPWGDGRSVTPSV